MEEMKWKREQAKKKREAAAAAPPDLVALCAEGGGGARESGLQLALPASGAPDGGAPTSEGAGKERSARAAEGSRHTQYGIVDVHSLAAKKRATPRDIAAVEPMMLVANDHCLSYY